MLEQRKEPSIQFNFTLPLTDSSGDKPTDEPISSETQQHAVKQHSMLGSQMFCINDKE